MAGVTIFKRRVKLAGMSQLNLASRIGPTKKEKSPTTCGTLVLNHQLKNPNNQPSKYGRKTRVLHLVTDGARLRLQSLLIKSLRVMVGA